MFRPMFRPTCRLFPPELIDAIASGGPPAPGALDAIARHMRGDWLAAMPGNGAARADLAAVSRELAWAAANGSAQPDDPSDPVRLPEEMVVG